MLSTMNDQTLKTKCPPNYSTYTIHKAHIELLDFYLLLISKRAEEGFLTFETLFLYKTKIGPQNGANLQILSQEPRQQPPISSHLPPTHPIQGDSLSYNSLY